MAEGGQGEHWWVCRSGREEDGWSDWRPNLWEEHRLGTEEVDVYAGERLAGSGQRPQCRL